MKQYSRYVGLDVHKDTIAVAVAEPGNSAPVSYGQIATTPQAITKLLRKMSPHGELVGFCYEAGPCGYGIYRQITGLGHDCMVVAPSLIPRKPGVRIKTDRRDARTLAQLFRSGQLTRVWVPDPDQEAVRDLVRCREDVKAVERHARQRLLSFLLRHGKVYSGKSRWTQAHFRWLEGLRFDRAAQQIVLQEYIETVKEARGRVAGLEDEMAKAMESWSLAPVVRGLMALRGVALVTAMTVMAELGDLTRFDSPRELMGFLGLVPSEYSSGSKRRQGGITKAGNGHVRRVLIEAAWSYRFPARKTAHLQRSAAKTSARVQAIAWKAQKRLCGRYQRLTARGKRTVLTCTAVARELSGFIWAIACEVMPEVHALG